MSQKPKDDRASAAIANAGRLLTNLHRAPDDSLAAFRERRCPKGSALDVAQLKRARDILDAVATAVALGDSGEWKRMEGAWRLLVEGADERKLRTEIERAEAQEQRQPEEQALPDASEPPSDEPKEARPPLPPPPALLTAPAPVEAPLDSAVAAPLPPASLPQTPAPLAPTPLGAAPPLPLGAAGESPWAKGAIPLPAPSSPWPSPTPPAAASQSASQPMVAPQMAPPTAPVSMAAPSHVAHPMVAPVILPAQRSLSSPTPMAGLPPSMSPPLVAPPAGAPSRLAATTAPLAPAGVPILVEGTEDVDLATFWGAPLPFKEGSAAPPVPSALDDLGTSRRRLLHEPLPFERQPPKSPSADARGAPLAEGQGRPPEAAPPLPPNATTREIPAEMTLEQYASLCASCAVFPEQSRDTETRFGIGSPSARSEIDAAWRERFHADSTLYARFYRRFLQYRDWLVTRRGPSS